jgi:lipoate---protein ligase
MFFRFIESTSNDIFLNLALENHFLLHSFNATCLLLWKNSPCVVIGRNQEPKYECNISLMRELKFPLVRRYSGGGAVFHDLGNSNYSLIMNKEKFSRNQGCELVQSAMKRLQINLEISPRHDLWYDGKKVSGSAYRLTNSRAFHHGTLLRDTDLTLLEQLLQSQENVDEKEMCPIRSVKSPVGNVSISHEEFCKAMLEEFRAFYKCDSMGIESITDYEILQLKGVSHFYKELTSLGWIWNRDSLTTPKESPLMTSKPS